MVAGASDSSTTLISLASVWSVGVGGNVPVDSAIFLGEPSGIHGLKSYVKLFRAEFLPSSYQYILTVLSVWRAFGQLLGSLVCGLVS